MSSYNLRSQTTKTAKHNESKRKRLSSSQLTPELPSIESFSSEIEEELILILDQLDCGMVSSTPVNSSRFINRKISFPSSFSCLDDQTSPHLFTTNDSLTLPLTSPYNTLSMSRINSVLLKPQEINNKNRLLLSEWDLPQSVIDRYTAKGITEMFSWQADCLSLPGVLTGHSIIYSAPTSAGKTLIAELLSLKCILENKRKVLIVLPFVSVVHEKVKYLHSMFEPIGAKVGGFMGNHSPSGGINSVDIAVCTIEKANSLVNHLLEEKTLFQLGVVVVDELQMISDHHRGYILELLLTKLLYTMNKSSLNITSIEHGTRSNTPPTIQLIGMTAELPNLTDLAKWLNAQVYSTDFRPVPLKEMIKIGSVIYDVDFTKITEIPNSTGRPGSKEERDLMTICEERLSMGHSVLIFCPTKSWCEKLSISLTKYNKTNVTLNQNKLNDISKELQNTQAGLDSVLEKTLPFGIAFHHAGLTLEEREIIEDGFRSMFIRILIATSTLSSGVNLPARLVIIRSPLFQQKLIDIHTYRQMIGRAGRMGIDDKGESILCCEPSQQNKVSLLLKSSPEPVQSCLRKGPSGSKVVMNDKEALNRAILEVIVSGTESYDDIILYMSCTFLCVQLIGRNMESNDSSEQIKQFVDESLQYLLSHEFIGKRSSCDKENSDRIQEDKYYTTQLGSATIAASLSPNDGLIVFREFHKAKHALVLENELHLIYLVTPVGIVQQWPSIDWRKFYYIWDRLPLDMKHVGHVIGIQDSYLIKALKGCPPERTPVQKDKVLVHCRFFISLVLHDLVKEIKLSVLSEKYGASKGFLQSLQLAAGTFSGMVTVFCSRLGWKNMEVLLSQFQNRLVFGVEKELCELVDISILNGRRARFLYNNGYRTLSDLATTNVSTIESLLRKASPFKSKMGSNWNNDNKGKCLTEYDTALIITQEARQLLCEHLNVPENYFFWNDNPQNYGIALLPYKDKSTTPNLALAQQQQKTPGLYDNNRTAIIKSKRLKLEEKSPAIDTPCTSSVQKSSFDLFMEYNNDDNNVRKHASPHTTNFKDTFTSLSSQYTSITSGISIVHLCKNETLLNKFVEECNSQSIIGYSVAVESISNIGAAFVNNKTTSLAIKGLPVKSEQVVGVSFTWDNTNTIAYYLSLCESSNERQLNIPSLSVRIKALIDIFSKYHSYTLVSLDFKKQVQYLMATCNLPGIAGKLFDPHLAHWMLDPDSNEMTINQLIDKYLINQPTVTNDKGSTILLTSFILHSTLSHLRASVESILSLLLINSMKNYFPSECVLNTFIENEMPVSCVLAKLELNGIGICVKECKSLKDTIEQLLTKLKEQAFVHAKRSFSLSSPKEIEQVLFRELKLPSFHAELFWSNDHLMHIRTTKDVLGKITSMHPLPGIILDCRRLNNTLISIKPLLNLSQYNESLQQYRVHSSCQLHTSTGRVSLTNPNIQNIPKEYIISGAPLISSTVINARSVIKSCSGRILIAADYSQLELRLLAHLSQDEKLCKFLNEEGDPFCKIASEWLSIDPCNVNNEDRQRTKSLCYGMIYGMGVKSLSSTLDVSEDQAKHIIETFKSRYTGMTQFMTRTIEQCRETGFIETILNRRRYLPLIHSKTTHEKIKAERQAINSTIQGSASDLVKKAMIAIDKTLTNSGLLTYYISSPSHTTIDSSDIALLVLQLHDELMYEVDENKLREVALIIKTEMESALTLAVKLPVKIKVGKSWGEMEPYDELK